MRGIAGILNFDRQKSVDDNLIAAMTHAMLDRHMKGGDDIGNRRFVLRMLEPWQRRVLDPASNAMSVLPAA